MPRLILKKLRAVVVIYLDRRPIILSALGFHAADFLTCEKSIHIRSLGAEKAELFLPASSGMECAPF
jgi:hypothetical protein